MDQNKIIQRIRNLRREQGLTLEQLAQQAGLSKGYLSKIENSKSKNLSPVSTLDSIAKALGVSLTWLLADEDEETSATKISLLCEKDRKPVVMEYRGTCFVSYPLSNKRPGSGIYPYLVEIPFEDNRVYCHEGEEFYFILEGRIKLNYGGREYVLEAGDCVHFDTDIPHSGCSLGKTKAKALTIFYNDKKELKRPFFQKEPLAFQSPAEEETST